MISYVHIVKALPMHFPVSAHCKELAALDQHLASPKVGYALPSNGESGLEAPTSSSTHAHIIPDLFPSGCAICSFFPVEKTGAAGINAARESRLGRARRKPACCSYGQVGSRLHLCF